MASPSLSSWLSAKSETLNAFNAQILQNQEDSRKLTAGESSLEFGIVQLRAKDTITRISPEKRSVVEKIDSEEDDAEFDERAHWARRDSRKKARATRLSAEVTDKSQPSIALFCTKKATSAGERGEATVNKDALMNVVSSPHVTQSEKLQEGKSGKRKKLKNTGLEWDSAVTTTKDKVAAVMSSRRPKRQVVVRAEILQQQQKLLDAVAARNNASSFLTPPPSTTRSDSVRSAITSGRKRKLELHKKKASLLSNNGSATSSPGTTKATQSFFLSELEKKQLQKIEAVSIFREQLRQTREKDLVFFAGKKANPFFQARTCSTHYDSVESEDGDVVECGAGNHNEAKQRHGTLGIRWSKPLPLFPDVQHVLSLCLDEEDLNSAADDIKPFKRNASLLGEISTTIVIHQDDRVADKKLSAEFMSHLKAAMNGQVCTESSFSEHFWFQELLNSSGLPSVDVTSPRLLNAEAAATEWARKETVLVDELVEAHGMREIRVRELLAGLEQAKTRRLDREQNLSLVDRYSPVNAGGLVGNRESLHTLSSWLSAWKIGGCDRERLNCFASELFTFEDGDSNSEDEIGDLCRLFILQGESGSGKSAAVYACAEELGFKIIEINAAQNRSGKSVVELCGEATQSTRVLHVGEKDVKSKKTHKKKRRRQSEGRKSLDKPTAAPLSLVLFEDVDLVFDDDKGFLCAVCSIAKHSKCPIVVTCAQLPDAFPTKPGRLSRELCKPSMDEFSTWMRLVAFIEGLQVVPSLIEALGNFFLRDVRRSLHFLEAILPISDASTKIHWRWQHDTYDESNDDKFLHVEIPAWTIWSTNGACFDALTSNLLVELSAVEGEQVENKSYEKKRADLDTMSKLAEIIESTSVADNWMTPTSDRNRDESEDSFFLYERKRLAALELRRSSLNMLRTLSNSSNASLMRRQGPSASACIQRTLESALKATQKRSHQAALAQLKPKFELPLAYKGCGKSEPRFTLDYMPMVGRLLSTTGLQEGRRRASRRNHYLGDVLGDMTLIDELPAFDSYSQLDKDQIVTAFPASTH